MFFALIFVCSSVSATYDWRSNISHSNDSRSSEIVIFVQVTDTHISKNRQSDDLFESLLKNTLPLIKPHVCMITGDITNAVLRTGGSRQQIEEWKKYARLLLESGILKECVWLDIRGNHDSFKVNGWNSSSNYYRGYTTNELYSQFSIRPSSQDNRHPYLHIHHSQSGDYGFLGIDLTPEMGHGRPFNFIGHLKKDDRQIVEEMVSEWANLTKGLVVFSHYPTPFVQTDARRTIRDILRHSGSLIELELGDWVESRRYRVGVFDRDGVMAFTDVQYETPVLVIVLRPKNPAYILDREMNIVQQQRIIRLFVRALNGGSVETVSVHLNKKFIGNATHTVDSVYELKGEWPDNKDGLHRLKITVYTSLSTEPPFIHETQCSFNASNLNVPFGDRRRSAFFLSSFNLKLAILFTHYAIFLLICLIVFFHFCGPADLYNSNEENQSRIRKKLSRIGQWMVTRMHPFFSDRKCFTVSIYSTLCYCFGPWAIGEISEQVYGAVFLWGTVTAKCNYTPPDMQYVYGSVHLFFFYIPLLLSLAYCFHLRRHGPKPLLTPANIVFILLSFTNFGLVVMFEIMYPPSILFSPISALSYTYVFFSLWIKAQLSKQLLLTNGKTNESIPSAVNPSTYKSIMEKLRVRMCSAVITGGIVSLLTVYNFEKANNDNTIEI